MKKVKRTKEEKAEIKKYKQEEKSRMKFGKGKIQFRREHIYLVFAFLVLILLICILIYMIFFSKSRDVIVPDLPTNETMDIGVIDFSDNGTTANDLNSKKNNNIAVSYNVVSDYYKEGILLSNTKAEFLNDSFIITSGPNSNDPFISSITKDGKLSWLTKLTDKEHGVIKVEKTIFLNDNYYVIANSTKADKKSLIVIKINSNGKKVSTNYIKSSYDGRVKDAIVVDKKIAVIISESTNIKVLFTDENLKEYKNEVSLSEYVDSSRSLNYQSGTNMNGVLNLIVDNSNVYFSVDIDMSTYSATSKDLTDLNDLDLSESVNITKYLEGYAGYSRDQIYKFDTKNKLINKIDYSKIKLENDKEFIEKYKDEEYMETESFVNSIEIDDMKVDDERLIVRSNTQFSKIYDIYDSTLKISKRIMLDRVKYTYLDGVLLNSFYDDGIIYEVYSYGSETPSIMISKIG